MWHLYLKNLPQDGTGSWIAHLTESSSARIAEEKR